MVVSGVVYTGTSYQATTLPTPIYAPTVTGKTITNITYSGATAGGNVTSDNGAPVIARGVAYATTQNPTISGSHTTDGSGTGIFTSTLTGLQANTTYYVRAYATNGVGTNYGTQASFLTLPMPVVVSINRTYCYAGVSGGHGAYTQGLFTITPPLTAGQSVIVNYSVNQVLAGGSSGDQNSTRIYYTPNSLQNTYSTNGPNGHNTSTGSITIAYGQSVCYYNSVSSNGLQYTTSNLQLTSATGSGGVSASISTTPDTGGLNENTYKDCLIITS